MQALKQLSRRPAVAAAASSRRAPLRVVAYTTGADGAAVVKVAFKVLRHCNYGQNLGLVGSAPALGAWAPESGARRAREPEVQGGCRCARRGAG